MLLPSSASNPANMMAQALTMYKSLVGNVSNGKPEGSISHTIAGHIDGDDHDTSSKGKDYISSVDTGKDDVPVHHDKPRFSLQSPPKGE